MVLPYRFATNPRWVGGHRGLPRRRLGGGDGFLFTEDRRSFYPEGTEPQAYDGFDVPGIVPLYTDPGDLILFAHRTYHAAFPNRTDEVRLSCALGFRPASHKIKAPWALPAAARQFQNNLAPRHLKYTEGYTGIEVGWRPVESG